MKYYGKIDDPKDLITVEKGEDIAAEVIATEIGSGGSIHNVPSGGTAGQVLKKNTATDYDLTWGDAGTQISVNGIVKGDGTGAVSAAVKSDITALGIPGQDTVTTVTVSGSGNAITSMSATDGAITATKGSTFLTSHQDISGKEDKSNKVTSISSSSTDTQYPSAKCVYDELDDKLDKNTDITGATKCKITYDEHGLVTSGSDLTSSDIPSLDASKITTGQFADAMIASASTWNAKQPEHSKLSNQVLANTGWSSNQKTVTGLTGVTASNTVIVSPAPSSVSVWADAGVYCSAQGASQLTFTCTSTPSATIYFNVVILD